MLQDMANIKASCIFYVMVGTFTHLEQSTISILSVIKAGIIRLIVQHDLVASLSLMKYPSDNLRQSSPDVLSHANHPMYI
jgi:hypothetical protein